MAGRQKKIVLVQWAKDGDVEYEVVELVNSCDYRIGQLLNRRQVEDLCQWSDFTVVIKRHKEVK